MPLAAGENDDAVIAMMVIVTVVVLIGWIVYKLASRPSALPAPMYCPSCGTVAPPQSKYQGSNALSIALFLLIFPACILYAPGALAGERITRQHRHRSARYRCSRSRQFLTAPTLWGRGGSVSAELTARLAWTPRGIAPPRAKQTRG